MAMPTRFSVPQRDTHRPQIPTCHPGSIQGCHPASSVAIFLSCRFPCRLQVFEKKAPSLNCPFPEVNPTKAEPAATIVKYPTHTREHRLRFLVQLRHASLLPLKTVTWEPSAMNAELG